jgi:beta-lactamase regulating signal transducer with metallopeptidase domain
MAGLIHAGIEERVSLHVTDGKKKVNAIPFFYDIIPRFFFISFFTGIGGVLLLTVLKRIALSHRNKYRLSLCFLISIPSICTASVFINVHGIMGFLVSVIPKNILLAMTCGFLLIYLGGVIFLSVRLLFDLSRLSYIRVISEPLDPENSIQIYQIVDEKSHRLQIKRKICVKINSFSQQVVSFGLFKPVILLPEELVYSKNTTHVSSPILHELIHIKRLDWFFSLISRIVTILLFFHPVIYMVTKQIRIKQEMICDETASLYVEKKKYLNALIKHAELMCKTDTDSREGVTYTGNLLARFVNIRTMHENTGNASTIELGNMTGADGNHYICYNDTRGRNTLHPFYMPENARRIINGFIHVSFTNRDPEQYLRACRLQINGGPHYLDPVIGCCRIAPEQTRIFVAGPGQTVEKSFDLFGTMYPVTTYQKGYVLVSLADYLLPGKNDLRIWVTHNQGEGSPVSVRIILTICWASDPGLMKAS